ncbi:MAG: type IV pilus twitching motility protein PilT [Opitutaceae bacterium]
MNTQIQWLVYLGASQGLFEAKPCLDLSNKIHSEVELVEFAESLLKKRICLDFDGLQTLVEEAYEHSLKGAPPENPFDDVAQLQEDGIDTPKDTECSEIDILQMLPELAGINDITTHDSAEKTMRSLLQACHELGASDLHVSAGARPFVRLNRKICYLNVSTLTPTTSALLNNALLSEERSVLFEAKKDLDFALALTEQERYRVNLMIHKEGVSGTYRLIPQSIVPIESLGFEDLKPIEKLLSYNNGLILVAGPIGSGKTVTLASMIDFINRNREDHLIAVEEPIEIVQRSKSCQITQREIGIHAHGFTNALKSALRQDPDVIVIGEMRDLTTIEMAISASETGHLVIGTLNTNDAANTLNRVLDVFPAAQQTQIRAMLSHALRGIICQHLVPSTKGGMALAYELLINNTAVCALIQKNKPEGLVNAMETGSADGMRLMDKSVLSLWERDLISDAVALKNLKSKIIRQQLSELIKLQKPTHLSE